MDSRSVTSPRWRPGTLGIEAWAAHSLCLADCKRGPLAGPPTVHSLPSLARGLRAGSTRLHPTAPRAASSPPWHPARILRPPPLARSPRSSPRDSFSNGAESLFTPREALAVCTPPALTPAPTSRGGLSYILFLLLGFFFFFFLREGWVGEGVGWRVAAGF